MRLQHYILSFVAGATALCSCSSQYNIDGNSTIAGLDGQTLYLRTSTINGQNRLVSLDSCQVVHGTFKFGGAMDSVFLAEVYVGNQGMVPVVVENGSVFVQMDNMAQTVSGGPLNERLNAFLTKHGRYEFQLWDLSRRARNMLYEGKSLEQIVAVIDPLKSSLLKSMKQLEVKFIKENYDNVLGTGYFIRMCDSMGIPTANEDILDILRDAPDSFLRDPYVNNYLIVMGLSAESLMQERTNAKKSKKKSKRS